MDSRKIGLMNLSAGKERRCRIREWACGHSGKRREEMNGESSVNIYALSGVRWIADETLLCSTGSSLVL